MSNSIRCCNWFNLQVIDTENFGKPFRSVPVIRQDNTGDYGNYDKQPMIFYSCLIVAIIIVTICLGFQDINDVNCSRSRPFRPLSVGSTAS